MWLGVDDTDSPRGGCTTYVLTELLALAREHGVDLIGEPRLVRLNPNIPWKTRGNAALAARFGRGRGPVRPVGEVGGSQIRSFAAGRPLPPSEEETFRDAAWQRVLDRSRSEDGTDPAMVVVRRPLPSIIYRRAVQEVVPVDTVVAELDGFGAWWRVRGDRRGLVGASAALAWPGRRATWELTSYRSPSRWGTPRTVDGGSVRRAARRHPELFLCHDPRTRRLLVAPHTPCPILFGLRATDPRALLAARTEVRSEPVDRWVVFRTNQGSGDHLVRRRAAELGPFRSGWISATVRTAPEGLPGGHARITVTDPTGTAVECVAFEPTKTLPRAVRALAPGDRVVVAGSRSGDPTLRLEALRIVRLVPRFGPLRAPLCPGCGRRSRSLGRSRGYRCPSCHRRWPPEAARRDPMPRTPLPAVVHPTASARRHLHPLAPEV